jgi:hypothetical protein
MRSKADTMRSVYLSDSGDDKNDGLSEQTPIFSWKRYLAMKGDDDGIIIMGKPKTVLRRLYIEIEQRK